MEQKICRRRICNPSIKNIVCELQGKYTLHFRLGSKCRMQVLGLAANMIVIALQYATIKKIKQECNTYIV